MWAFEPASLTLSTMSRGQHTLGVTRLDRAILPEPQVARNKPINAVKRYFNSVQAAEKEEKEKRGSCSV